MDDTTFIDSQVGPWTAGETITNPDTGTVWTVDASGIPYISAASTTDPGSALYIPDTGAGGTGPGGAPGDTSFSLGNVATGIMNTITAVGNQVPAAVNAYRNARTAIAAVRTPTATQQWLTMPLQSQMLWVVGIAAVVILAVRGKL